MSHHHPHCDILKYFLNALLIKDQIRLQLTYTEGEPKSSKVELAFRWWSKCISSVISRTASRNVLFSSARIGKALNVDRVPPLNDDSQDDTQFGSSGDDHQAFIDEFDLMITNQGTLYNFNAYTYICVYVTL